MFLTTYTEWSAGFSNICFAALARYLVHNLALLIIWDSVFRVSEKILLCLYLLHGYLDFMLGEYACEGLSYTFDVRDDDTSFWFTHRVQPTPPILRKLSEMEQRNCQN